MTLLAASFPPPEFIIFAVAILLGIIGKIVEFSRKVRDRSIESQKQEQPFGREPEERAAPPEPPRVEPRPRLDILLRRPLSPRQTVPPPIVIAPPPPPVRRVPHVVAPPPPPPPQAANPILRKLREPRGARDAIVLAEILGKPKALRGGR